MSKKLKIGHFSTGPVQLGISLLSEFAILFCDLNRFELPRGRRCGACYLKNHFEKMVLYNFMLCSNYRYSLGEHTLVVCLRYKGSISHGLYT